MDNPKNKIYIPFLSFAALSFICGIFFSYIIKVSFFVLFLVALVILIAFIVFARKRIWNNILVSILFFLIGMIHSVSLNTAFADDIYNLAKFKLRDVSIEGIVISQVQESPYNKSFVFSCDKIGTDDFTSKVSGKIHVRFNKMLDIHYGDHLIIEGKISVLKDKGFYNKRLIRQGVKSVLYVDWRDWITFCGHKFSLNRLAIQTKDKLKKRFEGICYPVREFMIAFILGDREGLSKELYSVFKYTGTVHIIAISGLNIGIIIFILLIFLKALRIKQIPRFIITIIFLLFYAFVTGLTPSVVRAVVMGIIFLFSYIFKREYHLYNSLALSAAIILCIWPWQIFDVGFQLSFISVFFIVFIGSKILLISPKIKNRVLSFVYASFVVSLSAWIGTAPLVAYYFGIISFVSMLANIFIVFLATLITIAGFIYLMMSYLMPFCTKWFALSLEFLFMILMYLELFFKNFPLAYIFVDKPAISLLFIYYIIICFVFNTHNSSIGLYYGLYRRAINQKN